MAVRIVNGNDHTEDGWPLVDQAGCTWIKIPGSNVTIQVQTGQPCAILGAWEADWNAYVEPLEDPTTGAWTDGNSVLGQPGQNNGSNHLGGTAVDSDWEKHPMGPHAPDDSAAGFTVDQVNTIREMIAFYTLGGVQMVWWANDWDSPHDSMHSQMGYNTFGNPLTQQFIDRFIRPDGFSKFRRGEMPATPPAANILADATGVPLDTAMQILPAIQDGLQRSECNNPRRIAMWLAQEGEESAGFTATVEIGNIDGTTYQGRTWEQITGLSNYAAFSQWAYGQGMVDSPTYFVDNPSALGDPKWESLGADWYWTVARPNINAMADAGDVVGVTEAINGGDHGLQNRTDRYNRALALGDQLLQIANTAITLPPAPPPGDDMATVPQEQWDAVYHELTDRRASRSPLRWIDQTQHYKDGLVDDVEGFDLNVDGMTHVQFCIELARYNHPPTMALLRDVAGADKAQYPDRADDIDLANAILAGLSARAGNPVQQQVQAAPVLQQTLPVQQTLSAPMTGNTNGAIIGRAYDALEALLASGALSDGDRTTTNALVGVLQTKMGTPVA